jgi:3-isopropylmalate/(R)-2-methylmalate dehydratase small subunit
VAGANFGCGSSREHAPLSLIASGISCIVARSFARIFFRNAVNIGLPLMECAEAVEGIEESDIVEIDLSAGMIDDLTRHKTFKANPYPEFMMEIINAGGLIEYTKSRLSGR